MREREVAQIPARFRGAVGWDDADAEKGDFESVPPAAVSSQMAGVVPPLRLVLVV